MKMNIMFIRIVFLKKHKIILPEVELACKSETDGHTYHVMTQFIVFLRQQNLKFNLFKF